MELLMSSGERLREAAEEPWAASLPQAVIREAETFGEMSDADLADWPTADLVPRWAWDSRSDELERIGHNREAFIRAMGSVRRQPQARRSLPGQGLEVTAYMPLAVGKVMDDALLKQIADAHDATPAQVALAWIAARDIIVIPSSTKPANQKSNLEALDIRLSDDEIEQIDRLDRGDRQANPDFAPDWDE